MKRRGLWISIIIAVVVMVVLVLSLSGTKTVGDAVTLTPDQLRAQILADGKCPKFSDEQCYFSSRVESIKDIGEECSTQSNFPGRCELTEDAPFVCICQRLP
jgi:hypothetical protein